MTEQEIKDALEGKLHPGMAVKIEKWSLNGGKKQWQQYTYKGCRKGVVEALHSHIFTVRVGRYLESYRYSQCIEQNETRVKIIR